MDVAVVEESDGSSALNGEITKEELPAQEAKKPPPKPLPRGPMVALSVMCVSVALSETVLFPFAAFMVASFNVTDDPAKLGYYAGYLASAFYAGGLVSSTVWGALSDKIGRKPVLVLGILANALCALGFGFSSSFSQAMATRFINGLLNGVIPVARTVISELCDASNQAQGFALIGVNWGIGFLIGPALGGLLCEPAKKYPSFFPPGSLFDTFAYAPPCLFLTVLSTIGLFCVIFFLPETRGRAKSAPQVVLSESSENLTIKDPDTMNLETDRKIGLGEQVVPMYSPNSSGRRLSFNVRESEKLLEPLLSRQGSKISILGSPTKGQGRSLDEPGGRISLVGRLRSWIKSNIPGSWKKTKGTEGEKGDAEKALLPGGGQAEDDPGSLRSFLVRETFICALIYSLLGLATGSQNEVFPLWGMTVSDFGGLGFGTDYIGIAQASAGLALVPFQLFLYSPLANRLGPLFTLKIMLTAMAALTAFPVALFFSDPKVRLFVCMLFFMVRGVSVICAFTSVVICLTNSIIHPQHLGAINGLLQMVNMIFEAGAPTLGASIYAWSISGHHPFPFDYHLYWLIWGIICGGMILLATLLPQDIDERKFITEDE